MIPKVIHYCWFGGNPLPELAEKCILSWKKYLPDYEVKEWNESNFDLNSCEYIKEAYQAKKWAFVSDYARFWILYHEGGLYFDTDVEIINPLDKIIKQGPFIGCEEIQKKNGEKSLGANPGLGLGAISGMNFYREILDYYENIHFSNENGIVETVVDHTTRLLERSDWIPNGKIQKIEDIYIYPSEYFGPYNYLTGKMNITAHTVSVHHYAATWHSKLEEKIIKIERCDRNQHPVEYRLRRAISMPFRVVNKLKSKGIKETIRLVVSKVKR